MARYNAANNWKTTLNGALGDGAGDLTFDVVSAAGCPSVPFKVTIDDEIMNVTNVATNTFTVTRGAEGTTRVNHWDETEVENLPTAEVQNDLWDEVAGKAASSHAHGNVTTDGKVGAAANIPLITGADGVVQAGSFGSAENTFCEGDDGRLSDSRTPANHNLVDTTGHPVSGLTTGHFLKASGETAYGFAAHGLDAAAVSALPIGGGTMTGKLYAQANTDYTTGQTRNVFLSTADPVDEGGNGDVWFKYTA